MADLQLNPETLEFICDDEGGAYQWFYDPDGKQYVCLNSQKRTYTFCIPAEKFFTEEQFTFGKLGRYVKEGLDRFVPPEQLRQMCAPQSNAVLKLCAHKARIDAGVMHGNHC